MQSNPRSLVVVVALGWAVALASAVLPSVALALPLSTNLIMYHDYDGDLLDNSGLANHGTGMKWDGAPFDFLNPVYQNSNTATISYGTGKLGMAAWINSDGTTPGNGNYITLGNHISNPDFNFGNTVTDPPVPPTPKDISISMWVKGLMGGSANTPFLSNKAMSSPTDGTDTGYYLRRGTGGRLNINMAYYDGDVALPNPRSDGGGIGPDLNDDVWHHVGVALDRDGSGRAFIDGNTTPAFTFSITNMALLTMNPSDGNLRINIGQDGTGGYQNEWTNGLLVDDIAIWKQKLHSGDFKNIYDEAQLGNSLATVLTDELAPEDPPPPLQIFNWNFSAHPTGNFGSIGTPPANATWLDDLSAPLFFAPNDPDGTGSTLHTVNIDNATVTVTDLRLVSSLNLAAAGTTTTLIVNSGAGMDITSVGGLNVGMAAGSNATMTLNGNAAVRTRGGFNINVALAGATGLVEQNDTSLVEVGIWAATPDNDFGYAHDGATVRLVIGLGDNITAEYRISDDAVLRGGRDIRIGQGSGANGTFIMEGNSTTIMRERLGFGDGTAATGPGVTATATIRDTAKISAQIISLLDGRQLDSVSTFNIQDNAVVNAGLLFTVGETIAGPGDPAGVGHGTAIVNQSGGTVNIGTIRTSAAVGAYQDNALLEISLGNIGNSGVKADGGTIDGRYNLSGGTLNASRFTTVGVNFDGNFNHSGGTANFKSGEFDAGTMTWSGGKAVSASFPDSGGHLTLGGTDGSGAAQYPPTSIGSPNALGNGDYNISGSAVMNVEGTMTVARHGAGTLKVTGGQANINVGTGYTIDTAWVAGVSSTPAVAPQGVFRVLDGDFTLGNSTGAGKLITEVTTTGVSAVNVHGNVTIGANSTYEVVATSLPANGAYCWDVLVADSDADGLYSGGPAAAFTGSFTTKTIPAVVDVVHGRKLRFLTEGLDRRIALGLSHDGDVNFDGVVDIFDVNAVSSGWNTTDDKPDANGDNIVDIFDVNMISSNWANNVNSGGVTAIPEPSSLVLGGLGIVGLVVARRRVRGRVTRSS